MRLRKTFSNYSSANTKVSKFRVHKIEKSRGFLDRNLGLLLKTALPLMKNALKPLAKSVLIPLALTVAVSATGSSIKRKIFGSGMKH